MRIPLIEPTSTRYIHVNPVTNRVHLLVPFVGGQDVSTDNTCRSRTELNAFFGGGGVSELEAYKRSGQDSDEKDCLMLVFKSNTDLFIKHVCETSI